MSMGTEGNRRLRICRVATMSFFLRHHLRSTLLSISQSGHELSLISGDDGELGDMISTTGAKVYRIKINREISIVQDTVTLLKLIWFLRTNRFDVLHSTTPKAGLVCAIAGFVSGVPLRFHTFTGQAWLLKKGLVRAVAKFCDRLIIWLNTQCYADSQSQLVEMIKEGAAKPNEVKVLGFGSLSGVDPDVFHSDLMSRAERNSLLTDLAVPENAIVINFTGRINQDKGVRELLVAFESLYRTDPNVILLIVGPEEKTANRLDEETLARLKSHPGIRTIGYTPTPEKYFAISNLFCLPSHREGFPNVVLEAALMGLPTVGTKVVGMVDTIVDGETGLLVKVNSPEDLAQALQHLIQDHEYRTTLGQQAKRRAIEHFHQKKINAMILEDYARWADKISKKTGNPELSSSAAN